MGAGKCGELAGAIGVHTTAHILTTGVQEYLPNINLRVPFCTDFWCVAATSSTGSFQEPCVDSPRQRECSARRKKKEDMTEFNVAVFDTSTTVHFYNRKHEFKNIPRGTSRKEESSEHGFRTTRTRATGAQSKQVQTIQTQTKSSGKILCDDQSTQEPPDSGPKAPPLQKTHPPAICTCMYIYIM